MQISKFAVLVIDVQRYYTEASSPLVTFTERIHPGGTHYLRQRLDTVVIPSLILLLTAARAAGAPVIYARLCGRQDDRADLHRNFHAFDQHALQLAHIHVYPLSTEPHADIDHRIAPNHGDFVIDKTGYSAFHATDLHQRLQAMGIQEVIMTGLTTSQCVNSTARSASDHGYITHMVSDALADYDATDHQAALYASEPITGKTISVQQALGLLQGSIGR